MPKHALRGPFTSFREIIVADDFHVTSLVCFRSPHSDQLGGHRLLPEFAVVVRHGFAAGDDLRKRIVGVPGVAKLLAHIAGKS